jgi:hypothetical protein
VYEKLRAVISILVLLVPSAQASEPLQLNSQNPHYFLFRGKPTVLITSGEHYGAVINLDFDYVAYLNELAGHHLNLTRTWIGSYRELTRDYDPKKGPYAIDRNTLAPKDELFLAPWQRAAGNKFDLSRWNPKYFARLQDFLSQASRRGIVVELNLFCSYYDESLWEASPLNSKNNINGIGEGSGKEAYTLRDKKLLAAQDALTRKIVEQTQAFDNVYYEICNEPYWGNVTVDWQRHISQVIAAVEAHSRRKHLISQNVAEFSSRVADPDPNVSIFNFHYSRPPDSVAMNYALNRPIGMNETGFDGQADATYRIQGWDFLMAGGALYNNLDFSFAVGNENGDFKYPSYTPGGGTLALREQLGILHDFFNQMNFIHMVPDPHLIAGGLPAGAIARALAEPGKQYAIYIHHGHVLKDAKPQYTVDEATHSMRLLLNLPSGSYQAIWIDTRTGHPTKKEMFVVSNGTKQLDSPNYSEDIALRVMVPESYGALKISFVVCYAHWKQMTGHSRRFQ